MTAEYPTSGLMKAPENDILEQLKREIYRKDKPLKTIRQRIGELTSEDKSTLVSIAQIVLAFQQATVTSEGVTNIDYRSLIERLYKGLKPELKVLLTDVLQEIEPVKVVAKKEAKPSGRSIYEDERYFPKRDLLSKANENIKGFNPRVTKGRKDDQQIEAPSLETVGMEESNFNYSSTALLNSNNTTESSYVANKTFLDKLVESESSSRSDAEITLDDGRKFVGKLQFGEARLKDYQKAIGTRFTQEEFKDNLALQDRVAAWHLEDLSKAVDELGDAAKGYSKEGLLAVGHLGGKSGMKQFVKSKGQYDPEDALGTSPSEYYNKFSGAA